MAQLPYRIRVSSSLQSAGMGGSDAHLSFFAHLSHLGPSWGDFKVSRRNCNPATSWWSCCPIIREETIIMSRQMVGTNWSNHLELLGSQN